MCDWVAEEVAMALGLRYLRYAGFSGHDGMWVSCVACRIFREWNLWLVRFAEQLITDAVPDDEILKE